MRNTRIVLSLSLLALFLTIPAIAEDWTRFRGENGVGTSDSKNLPAEFGPDKNKVWEAEVPFGRSLTVIAGNRIYVTATDDGKFVTMALDRKTGKERWKYEAAQDHAENGWPPYEPIAAEFDKDENGELSREEIWASPVIADGRLYVRTRGTLYSFGVMEQ